MNDPDGRIDDELRSAGAQWRSKRPSPSNALNPALFTATSGRPNAARRAIVSFAGVLAVAVVAILVVVSLPPRDHHVATGSPSPSAPATSRTSLSPTSPPTTSPIHWQRAASIPDIGYGMRSIRVVDGAFVGQASNCGGDATQCQHIMLTSPDGNTWTATASITLDSAQAKQVTIFHDDRYGYIAVGTQHAAPGAAIWRSDDGQTWESIGGEPAFTNNDCGAPNQIVDVYDVYVASGAVVALGQVRCGSSVLHLAWMSRDGHEWVPSTTIPVFEVARRGSAYVGLSGSADGQQDGLWSSSDGLAWTQVDIPLREGSLASVATGFVMVGPALGDNATTVLTSIDGTSWHASVQSVLANSEGLLRSDGQRAAFADGLAKPPDIVWISSTDGLDWTQYEITESVDQGGILGATILGNRAVAWTSNPSVVWFADVPPAGPTPEASPTPTTTPNATPHPTGLPATPSPSPTPSPTPRATLAPDAVGWVNEGSAGFEDVDSFLSSATNHGVTVVSGDIITEPLYLTGYLTTWSTTDGSNWKRSEIWSGLQDKYFVAIDLVSYGTGFAAFAVQDSGGGTLSHETYVYLSPDGDQWTLSAMLDGFNLDAAASVGGSLVTAGRDANYHGSIWLSSDGANWHQPNDLSAPSFGFVSDIASYGSRVAIFAQPADSTLSGADIWYSDDAGATWTHATQPSVAKDAGPGYARLSVGVAGWVAVGAFEGVSKGTDFSWWSRDGSDWQKVTMPTEIASIVAYSGGFIAGVYKSSDPPGGTGIWSGRGTGQTWVSTDGQTWSLVHGTGWKNQMLQQLAINGETLIGLSTDPSSDTMTPGVLWLANLDTFGE